MFRDQILHFSSSHFCAHQLWERYVSYFRNSSLLSLRLHTHWAHAMDLRGWVTHFSWLDAVRKEVQVSGDHAPPTAETEEPKSWWIDSRVGYAQDWLLSPQNIITSVHPAFKWAQMLFPLQVSSSICNFYYKYSVHQKNYELSWEAVMVLSYPPTARKKILLDLKELPTKIETIATLCDLPAATWRI